MEGEKKTKEYALKDAINKFATPAQRRVRNSIKVDIPEAHPNMSREEAMEKLPLTILALGKLAKEHAFTYVEMQKRLCELLETGRLTATGVQIGTTPSVGRTTIPSFLFDNPTLRPAENKLENFGYKFEGVRVSRTLANTATSNKSAIPRQSGPGRPSRVVEINAAIADLCASGIPLQSLPRKKAYLLIRDRVLSSNPGSEIGLQNAVIQRALFARLGKRV